MLRLLHRNAPHHKTCRRAARRSPQEGAEDGLAGLTPRSSNLTSPRCRSAISPYRHATCPCPPSTSDAFARSTHWASRLFSATERTTMPIDPYALALAAVLGLTIVAAAVVSVVAILRADRNDVVAVVRALPELAATLMRWRRRR